MHEKNGVVTTYQYDALDRITSKTFTQNGDSEIWTYTYDEFGRVTKTDQNGRMTETKYTPQGQVEKIVTPEGTITYTYDAFGRQTSVQADDDAPAEYGYDNFGRLNQVKSGSETTCYEYDAFGNLVLTTTKTGTQTIAVTYEYDNMNRLTKLTNYVDRNQNNILADNERISQFDYVLDWMGRKDNAVETFWSQYGEQKNLVDGNYDSAGRLVYEKFNHYNDVYDQTSEWLCYLVGNRLSQTVNGVETAYSYDVNDRLLSEITGDKFTQYGYDHTQQTGKTVTENGILVSETTFEYDAQGRMAVVTITTAAGNETTSYE